MDDKLQGSRASRAAMSGQRAQLEQVQQIVRGFARRQGLPASTVPELHDAAIDALPSWNPDRATLSTFLHSELRNTARRLRRDLGRELPTDPSVLNANDYRDDSDVVDSPLPDLDRLLMSDRTRLPIRQLLALDLKAEGVPDDLIATAVPPIPVKDHDRNIIEYRQPDVRELLKNATKTLKRDVGGKKRTQNPASSSERDDPEPSDVG